MKRAIEVYRLRRTALAGVALLAFFIAIVATTAAVEGHPDAGVVIESGRIEIVSPTGFAWRDGVRAGQSVLSSTKSDAPEGWSVRTAGPRGPIESREAPVLEALRATLPFALVGLAAGCLSIAFVRLNRAWALPSSSLALVGASVPMFLANHGLSTAVLAGAALVPAFGLAYARRRSRATAVVVALAAIGLVVCWAVAYSSGGDVDQLEQARRVLALGGTGLLIVDRTMHNGPIRIDPSHAPGAFVAVLVISIGLGLVYFAAFPAPLMAIGIVFGLVLLPPIRAVLGRRLELALMADLRHQVAADVADEERGRLARELHDQPMQELAAVIRRLELVPEARSERSSLLEIAEQLRSVAVDLRPPMLDDIGLGSAIEFLADQVNTPGIPVLVTVEDGTGLDRTGRPPAAVEFALYRIVGEAVTNALKHARASSIAITGHISVDAVDLVIIDDGVGMPGEATRRASGRGRLGLASMRRRAQGIGAELSIDGGRGGSRIAVSWRG